LNINSTIILPILLDNEDKTCPLKNRIRKNYQHIRKWAKRTLTNCFRIYDRDIKEYPLAIDFYDGKFCIHFFTFEKDSYDPPIEFCNQISQILHSLFSANTDDIFWRTRFKREKVEQYEKQSCEDDFFTVLENGAIFKVNLKDYLDTGLFLDHRTTREIVAKGASGKRILNLFSYTASFSVQAALHGAIFTKSVDMSNTYSKWARDNFQLNQLSDVKNVIVRADVQKFLEEEILTSTSYDMIVIDPPTISRSKKMEKIFDIQIDYVSIIRKALNLLSSNGVIYFSTNSRKFRFDATSFSKEIIQNITEKTIPIDFHDKKIHQCWKITKNNL
jgi:23S rRNA G2069 N7-methylase RlmK/C1962 C5-methylase RlmI